MVEQTIGFLGAGQMARALARGFINAGIVAPKQILASDAQTRATDEFTVAIPGTSAAESNRQLVEACDVVVLAVKPQQAVEVLQEIAPVVDKRKLIISIAAGVPLKRLHEALGAQGRLVRVMPNTPCLVAQSASGYCLGPGALVEDGPLVEMLLKSVGRAFPVEEKLLDAVTGLSGSGPAFVYLMIEALSDGGVLMGLPRDAALALAAQTVKGAAEMVLATADHPAVLKDRVASPGGTTIAGLKALETAGVRAGLIAAVEAAARRSAELGAG